MPTHRGTVRMPDFRDALMKLLIVGKNEEAKLVVGRALELRGQA